MGTTEDATRGRSRSPLEVMGGQERAPGTPSVLDGTSRADQRMCTVRPYLGTARKKENEKKGGDSDIQGVSAALLQMSEVLRQQQEVAQQQNAACMTMMNKMVESMQKFFEHDQTSGVAHASTDRFAETVPAPVRASAAEAVAVHSDKSLGVVRAGMRMS